MRSPRTVTLGAILVVTALVGGSTAVTAASDISTWKTEEVEPGVLRVLDDGAGHDLTERYPDNHRDMDHIAIAEDGTVWIAGTASGEDNAHLVGFIVWPLGQEGLYGIEDGVPESIDTFEFAPDGKLRAVGAGVAEFDGSTWTGAAGSHRVVGPDGTIWFASIHGGVESWDGEAFDHHLGGRWIQWLGVEDGVLWALGDGYWQFEDGRWWLAGESMSERGAVDPKRRAEGGDGAIWSTSGNGVTRRMDGEVTRFLTGRPINQIALAPDGAVWAIGGVSHSENGGVYRIESPTDS